MKVVTWNVQWARGMDGRVDPARVIAHARELADFDVLCLQEVADNFPELEGSDGGDQFRRFADLLPGFSAVDGIGLETRDQDGGPKRFGNMLLTRYPVAQVIRYALPWEAGPTRSMPRVLIEVTAMAPRGPVRLMTTHLEYHSAALRWAQVEGIRQAHRTACERAANPREDGPHTYRRTETSASAILTGDFNMRPEDPQTGRISAPFAGEVPPLVDLWPVLHGTEPHPASFCLHEQTYGEPHCCDYVFATPDLAERATSIAYDLATRLSDHQPVLVEIED